MKAVVAVLCALVALCAAAPFAYRTEAEYAEDFTVFVKTYNKNYTEAEAEYRRAVFVSNLKAAEKMTADEEEEAVFGVTKFMDLTPEEFAAQYLMPKAVFADKEADDIPEADLSGYDFSAIPTSFDWRNKPNSVTPVKDQQQCGSCWAFSATENIESVWAIQGKNTLTSLSVQEIVSCDKVDQGCNGGDTVSAFTWVSKTGGLEAEKSYPYTSGAGDTGVCKLNKNLIVANYTGFEYATKTENETAMAVYLVNNAPLSICVDASTWQFYVGGIVKKLCGRALDHCVQLTGYDKTGATPYWIVRNSWNTDWGNKGYIYVEMGENECGIAKEATSVYIR